MSQLVGSTYKSRIPSLSDDATIEEALRVYHYGTDDWTIGNPIPNDSVEGNFVSVYTAISGLSSSVSALGTTYVALTSDNVTPNVVVPEDRTTVPLTIRGVGGQTGNLLQFQNNSSTNLAIIFSDGAAAVQYLTVGGTTKTTTTALNLTVANSVHKGLVIKGASSQSGNLQEWQNNSGTVLGYVDSAGKVFSVGVETVTLSATQTLTNKTLTSPTISSPTFSTTVNVTSPTATGSIGVRQITMSTAAPSGGADGDVWVTYV